MEKIYRVKLNSKGMPNFSTAVEIADRPQGHYIKGENGEWYCSECKRIDDKYSVARFCWHCGARMKGADDEMR
jgi:NADH pyrophosphatase NudC (nudix superfamily)